jgi:enolase-phosphatase E1
MNSKITIKTILVDIEGTTSSINFVHEVLFPYAKEKLKSFIIDNFDRSEVKELMMDVLETVGVEAKEKDQIIRQSCKYLSEWINEDKKIRVLKELQGLIWEDGYKDGAFHGHIYEDAYKNLSVWKEQGYELFVYSSGSVKAQKLLFGHTQYGDLNNLFSGNFDTTIGAKRDEQSYIRIAKTIKKPCQEILFLSDNNEELIAAQKAGMEVIKLARPEDKIPASDMFTSVQDFNEIKI